MEQLMEPSGTKVRILDLPSWIMPKSTLHSCEYLIIYKELFINMWNNSQWIIIHKHSSFSTDFVWAKAMGYTGDQINDVDGTPLGLTSFPWNYYL